MLPEDNMLPTRTYDAKQVLASIGLTHEKIHVCPNDCILFRKEYASLSQCPKCNESRYIKNKSTPTKVMWYFPVIPRLRRLFCTAENAKHMTWHAEGRIRDEKLRHPADSPQWKKFDDEYEDFAAETRNIRFALATDGMNPHGMQSSTRSTWPENGIEVYYGFRDEYFTLKAMLYGTINDFPAYGNLSGYSIKGQCACPICSKNTDYIRLEHCHKNGKKKDGINARLDLVKMRIRSDLAPVKKGKRTFLPPTACTLSRHEKRAFCEALYSVKVPEGYSSNIKSLVSLKDLKLKGLKSHDCHILMENLIPCAIRSILPKKVHVAITKLCFFFKTICSKVIDPAKLPALQNHISETLCELEMYFLPSFFDIIVHLTIQLVEETKLCGPAYM
ncbi:uncharacterized protein LOC113859807 [Abrus precatorius]|uniref:Uncharacterized protein LOC113859807 n=1 Tax=Abrus precatorius TaxID=3816 RepID=A0A8B8KWL0_ABRPR|nr:uncharacterized protein LOC113859807 [Abrus precatorius]